MLKVTGQYLRTSFLFHDVSREGAICEALPAAPCSFYGAVFATTAPKWMTTLALDSRRFGPGSTLEVHGLAVPRRFDVLKRRPAERLEMQLLIRCRCSRPV